MEAIRRKKKLVEVALPLDDINKACIREKSIRQGHPSALHLWWARRPLAAARAILFAQMVDDPSGHPELFPTEDQQNRERDRLFDIIRDLVQWDNTANLAVLEKARVEIRRSWQLTCTENIDHPRAKELFDAGKLPSFYDPFAGGGSLPLEAERLGLEAYASDLNPVAVLINKAVIELPPRFAGKAPINPASRNETKLLQRSLRGVQGVAEDIRFYGRWMRDEATRRIGQLYPMIKVTSELAERRPDLKPLIGQNLTVIAWLWARTVKSPNPAFSNVDVPLLSSFMLSANAGKEAYLRPIVDASSYRLEIQLGRPADMESAKKGTKTGHGANFRCLMSGEPITGAYIKSEGMDGRMGMRLTAVVADSPRGRVYLPASVEDELVALAEKPQWSPEIDISGSTQYVGIKPYGMHRFADLFTSRQLVALSTFSDLIADARKMLLADAIAVADSDTVDDRAEASAYADAVATYLAFALSKQADLGNTLCRWEPIAQCPRNLFGRQAYPMVWDFAESNPLGNSSGSWTIVIDGVANALSKAFDRVGAEPKGYATQADAMNQRLSQDKVVSTDPPYYDNVPYADLSDFFYVWLRRSLKAIYPDLFVTVGVPKSEELVAFAHRHGNKEQANAFFLNGMMKCFRRLAETAHPAFPITIYYAFKQSETDRDGSTASTGWETFLDAVSQTRFALTGTWPVRTENDSRMRGQSANALASSIVISCRLRDEAAPVASRREFINALKDELPGALAHLQASNIAPVDLAQSAIGPGMAIYTRYTRVLDADGNQVSVRDALGLINEALDQVLAQQEGDFDAATRFAVAWYDQVGFSEGDFGVATVLSRAKNTSVTGLAESGILVSRSGKVRLLRPAELNERWEPPADSRSIGWEVVHHLIRELEAHGERAAASIVAKLDRRAEIARELAYRLYSVAERRKRPSDALSYNGLVQSWPEILELARESNARAPVQTNLLEAR